MGTLKVGGVHGVGKSTIIRKAVEQIGQVVPVLKGSEIMAKFLGVTTEELISQSPRLREQAREHMYKVLNQTFLGVRDAHFCVYTHDFRFEFPFSESDRGVVTAAVVIRAHPQMILERRRKIKRKRILDLSHITTQQNHEVRFAKRYCEAFSIPLFLISNSDSFDRAVDQLAQLIKQYVIG